MVAIVPVQSPGTTLDPNQAGGKSPKMTVTSKQAVYLLNVCIHWHVPAVKTLPVKMYVPLSLVFETNLDCVNLVHPATHARPNPSASPAAIPTATVVNQSL